MINEWVWIRVWCKHHSQTITSTLKMVPTCTTKVVVVSYLCNSSSPRLSLGISKLGPKCLCRLIHSRWWPLLTSEERSWCHEEKRSFDMTWWIIWMAVWSMAPMSMIKIYRMHYRTTTRMRHPGLTKRCMRTFITRQSGSRLKIHPVDNTSDTEVAPSKFRGPMRASYQTSTRVGIRLPLWLRENLI